MITGRVFLALILAVLFVVYDLSDVSIGSLIINRVFPKKTGRSKVTREPIVFSKSKYLNQPRRVRRSLHLFIDYYLIILA